MGMLMSGDEGRQAKGQVAKGRWQMERLGAGAVGADRVEHDVGGVDVEHAELEGAFEHSSAARRMTSSKLAMQTPITQDAAQSIPSRSRSYSVDVRLYLILESGERVDLWRTCEAFVDLREPRTIEPGRAVVEVRVDHSVHRTDVIVSAAQGRRVPIQAAQDAGQLTAFSTLPLSLYTLTIRTTSMATAFWAWSVDAPQ